VLSGAKTQIPISDETQDRVRQAAEALGYRPHPSARALSGKRTNLIGVIVREIKDPFFADLIDAVSFAAREEGYDLVLGNARRDPEEALLLRDMMLDMRYCDGILLCGDLHESDQERGFLTRMSRDHRLVSVARGSGPLVEGVPSVDIDNRLGVQLALDYLLRLGHRQIACLDASRIGDLRERLEAYRAFMDAHFGGVPQAYVQRTENSYEGGYAAARQLLSLPTPPTAIFAADDMMAVGVLAAAHDMGLVVPDFVSVIGFDDMALAHCVRPTLTTVRQPIQEMGERSLHLLWQMIEEDVSPAEASHIQLEPELAIRASCGSPR
jgi:DNA-binding LacI/PurR family transcriptional regulator